MSYFPRCCTVVALAVLFGLFPLSIHAQTGFAVGGYIKTNVIASKFTGGEVGAGSLLRDFHVPGLIPVGGRAGDTVVDFQAKESRFNLTTTSDPGSGPTFKTFIEMDFMLSDAGDERVSNSYQPRLRHAYVAYDNFLVGQSWSTFTITTLPDNLDFIGATEGVVFVRQPQLRYTTGGWQFALENPETTITPYGGGPRIDADSGAAPDLVARYNLDGDWGSFSAAGIYRQLNYDTRTADAYGVNVGGKFILNNGDDLRFVLTRGSGLGRYVGLNFVNGAVLDADNGLEPIDTSSGYIAYLHHWNSHWRSSFDVSALTADNDTILTGTGVNRAADSLSVNLLYSPHPELTYGVELTRAGRELESGVDGAMNRIQFSMKYNFTFRSEH